MAERELRRMNRMELIEIIYALKQHEEELEQQNAFEVFENAADGDLLSKNLGAA